MIETLDEINNRLERIIEDTDSLLRSTIGRTTKNMSK